MRRQVGEPSLSHALRPGLHRYEGYDNDGSRRLSMGAEGNRDARCVLSRAGDGRNPGGVEGGRGCRSATPGQFASLPALGWKTEHLWCWAVGTAGEEEAQLTTSSGSSRSLFI